jgi:tetratricopeptide (TPR) repeat protein
MYDVASVYREQKQYEKALSLYEKALQTQKTVRGIGHAIVATETVLAQQ